MLVDATTEGYAAATRPHNSSVEQRPARVAVATRPADVAAALDEVAALARSSGRPLEIVPQATGHGAGVPVGEGAVLLDTSGLAQVSIDPSSRVAAVGAGATWSAVNAAAEQHGLLGLAGSAPSVSVSGAVVTPPGEFVHHAVAPLDLVPRGRVEAAFARARAVWSSADAGSTPGSWVDGAAVVPDALPPDVRERAAAIADAVDPGARIRRSRLLG